MCLGVPGKVEKVWDAEGTRMAEVDFGGVRKEVCLAYVPETQVGDYVLVHVGFAISQIDEEEAREIFSYIEQIEALGELRDTEPPRLSSGPPGAEAVT